jgi:hypothetical protein
MLHGKYVMTHEGAILFPMSMKHSVFRFTDVTSAGCFSIDIIGDEATVIVYGDSLTLGLCPAETDAERIIQCFAD